MTMKPPPPMLPALGCVTASAKAVATAASMALPPFLRIAAPTSEAGEEVETTIPAFDATIPLSDCAARLTGESAKARSEIARFTRDDKKGARGDATRACDD